MGPSSAEGGKPSKARIPPPAFKIDSHRHSPLAAGIFRDFSECILPQPVPAVIAFAIRLRREYVFYAGVGRGSLRRRFAERKSLGLVAGIGHSYVVRPRWMLSYENLKVARLLRDVCGSIGRYPSHILNSSKDVLIL